MAGSSAGVSRNGAMLGAVLALALVGGTAVAVEEPAFHIVLKDGVM